MHREEVIEQILRQKLIAILRGIPPEKALPTVQALYEGGIGLVEVTFNQATPSDFDKTGEMIASINAHFAGKVLVGAGTVVTPQQVELAAQSGAQYMISPGLHDGVVQKTRQLGRVSIPGAATPSEIAAAHQAGADFVKLFPAGDLGVSYVKAVRGPLNHIPFLAVGGIDEHNIPDYLAAGCCGFGIGGNLVNTAWVQEGQYQKLTDKAQKLCRAVAR